MRCHVHKTHYEKSEEWVFQPDDLSPNAPDSTYGKKEISHGIQGSVFRGKNGTFSFADFSFPSAASFLLTPVLVQK